MRICFYGFSRFVEEFFHKYPENFISPLRLSGSAIETLFSQFKHVAGGKFSSANYVTAMAAHLVKYTVVSHRSGLDYRDTSLSIPHSVKDYHLHVTLNGIPEEMHHKQKSKTELGNS